MVGLRASNPDMPRGPRWLAVVALLCFGYGGTDAELGVGPF